MTFASTILKRTIEGARRCHEGTYTAEANDNGGNIETGLKTVEMFDLIHGGEAVVADVPVVNETFPLAGGAVTIVCSATAQTGYWKAWGTS